MFIFNVDILKSYVLLIVNNIQIEYYSIVWIHLEASLA